jgi:hypothetical protein
MTNDGELRELFAKRADDVDIDRAMPRTLLRRVRRRQGLTALLAVLAVCAVVGAVFTGASSLSRSEPAPAGRPEEGAPPTPERVEGIWVRDPGPLPGTTSKLLVRFYRDGTVAFDMQGQLHVGPAILGTYKVIGDTIAFTVAEGCNPGGPWTWHASVSENGRMNIVNNEATNGDCSVRIGIGVEKDWEFTRLSPRSPAAELIIPADPPDDRSTVPSESMLTRTWIEESGGRLFSLSIDATYTVDDGLGAYPDDSGVFEMDERRGILRFISGRQAPDCPDGAQMVWRNVRTNIAGTTLRGVVEQDDCRNAAGNKMTLVLLAAAPKP